jgi:hypothetical protein
MIIYNYIYIHKYIYIYNYVALYNYNERNSAVVIQDWPSEKLGIYYFHSQGNPGGIGRSSGARSAEGVAAGGAVRSCVAVDLRPSSTTESVNYGVHQCSSS